MLAKVRWILCGAALLLSASCVESDNPLSDPAKSAQDTRAYGLWVRKNDRGDLDYLHIGAEKMERIDKSRTDSEPGLMRFCMVSHSHQSGGLSEASQADCFRTRIAGEDYANWVVPADEAKQRPASYMFMKYHLDGNQLALWDMDVDLTARAIETGKIKGIVKRRSAKPGDFEQLRITDPSDHLGAFLSSAEGKACFPDKSKSVYTRVQ